MAGINSLGIGSGVLTADVLDQLREADDSVILKPLEKKLELSNQKDEAYKLLSGFMSTFKSSTSTLGSENLYLGRQSSGGDDNVSVTVKAGADLTSFNITEVVKAERDVWNSGTTLENTTTAIPNVSSGVLTVSVGGKDLEIAYSSTTTLSDIREAINDSTAIEATATNLKVGEDAYTLSLSSNNLNEAITFSDSNITKQLDTVTLTGNAVAGDTFSWSDGNVSLPDVALVDGETPTESGVRIAQAINDDPTLSALYTAVAVDGGFTIESVTDGLNFNGTTTSTGTQTSADTTTTVANDGSNSLFTALGLAGGNIQPAREASFKMNGIAITRSTNTIDDLVNGVTINLNKSHATGAGESTSITIGQNDTAITTEMDLFVTNYNLLASNLKDMTLYDSEKGTAGIFNSESFIKSITSELKNIITKTDSSGNSLYDYGVEIDKEGVMSLDSSKLSAKLSEDSEALEALFRGTSATTTLYKQVNTVTLTGDAQIGDNYTWSDGVNGISIDFDSAKTPTESAVLIAQAINDDPELKSLYTATAIGKTFTIEAKTAGLVFSGASSSTGTQTSKEIQTTSASKTANDAVLGIFKELDNKMLSYTGSNKLLANFSTQINDSRTNLIAEYDKQKSTLDVRYETMAKKFAAYDAVINKLNNQFASLKSMIDAEANSD